MIRAEGRQRPLLLHLEKEIKRIHIFHTFSCWIHCHCSRNMYCFVWIPMVETGPQSDKRRNCGGYRCVGASCGIFLVADATGHALHHQAAVFTSSDPSATRLGAKWQASVRAGMFFSLLLVVSLLICSTQCTVCNLEVFTSCDRGFYGANC